jgi:hypothetical protein
MKYSEADFTGQAFGSRFFLRKAKRAPTIPQSFTQKKSIGILNRRSFPKTKLPVSKDRQS